MARKEKTLPPISGQDQSADKVVAPPVRKPGPTTGCRDAAAYGCATGLVLLGGGCGLVYVGVNAFVSESSPISVWRYANEVNRPRLDNTPELYVAPLMFMSAWSSEEQFTVTSQHLGLGPDRIYTHLVNDARDNRLSTDSVQFLDDMIRVRQELYDNPKLVGVTVQEAYRSFSLNVVRGNGGGHCIDAADVVDRNCLYPALRNVFDELYKEQLRLEYFVRQHAEMYAESRRGLSLEEQRNALWADLAELYPAHEINRIFGLYAVEKSGQGKRKIKQLEVVHSLQQRGLERWTITSLRNTRLPQRKI